MTTTETSTNLDQTIDTYFAMWNEADRTKRLAVIAEAWADDAHYVDPLSDVTGHDGLADMVDAVRAQFPGATLQRTTDLDAHHNIVKFGWSATGPDGALIVAGTDVAIVAPDGRLSALAGFFSLVVGRVNPIRNREASVGAIVHPDHMKTTTCKALGGPCDFTLRGSTPDDVIKAQDAHLKEMVKDGDATHEDAFQAMRGRWKNPIKAMGWYRATKREIAALPEA